MGRLVQRLCGSALLVAVFSGSGFAQAALTWQDVRNKFEAQNPSLQAGQIGVNESRAEETSADLRPNPTLTLLGDQIDPFPGGQSHNTFSYFLPVGTVSYLHEREHKRELRLESAQDTTKIAVSQQADLDRTLLFTLRMAFVETLQEKAVLDLAKENLAYYDHVLDVNRQRYAAGDIAQVDLDRLELQRVQYESDLQTADVNLRTAKIQLLALLNDRTPVERFDVTGPFDFSAQITPLDDVRQAALNTRPDLAAAMQAVDKAQTDHRLAMANGSTDPTFGADVGRNPPIDAYFGFSVSIPLRVFDKNQGEKLRTQLDIDRNQRLQDAARAQVFSDVDSAYAVVGSSLILLQPYKDRYLEQATRVRDTIAFSYQNGGASLLDFLNAQADYRSVQVGYLNLVASYLNAAAQLNLAVGRGHSMKWLSFSIAFLLLLIGGAAGCGDRQFDPQAGAPPALQVERASDPNLFQVEHPERFALAAAVAHDAVARLAATGTVTPDVSRTVPVISMVTGRVVEIRARLGDQVTKGQVLLRVQSPDMSSAFSDYQKAVADEQLARTQTTRAELLYSKGAISQNDLQVAENTESKAQVDVKTTADKLRVLGNPNLDQPSGVIDIVAPVSGYITDQEVTNAAGVQSLSAANPFTISDLSSVWILCDVYEDDLASIRVGQKAEIHLNAFPNRMFTGTIGNIGPVLDPNLRTAKVRIEVINPGIMRPGMFATATFYGDKAEKYAAVPATAVLHLHDRDWVYLPAGGNSFRRVEVKAGDMVDDRAGRMQTILSGVKPAQQVVANALEFQNTVEQQ